MNMRSQRGSRTAALVSALGGMVLVACSGSGGSDSVTVQGDVPLVYVMRSSALAMNPTDGTPTAPGGDLMVREKSSPSAPEHNLTARFTRDAAGTPNGDASDPEVSYDGKKIVFSLRCPASNTATVNGAPACTGRWNIWEYDMTAGGLAGGTFRRITASTSDDDVDPAYLPGDRGFVFSSNRQTKSKVTQPGGQTYYALDEYERERVLNLHTMSPTGANITQISFNQSHDRNPVVRPNGEIMFSRWEHVGERNRFAVFTVRPDGTGMFVLYGAQSPGNSFLHPRDMDPNGRYKGSLTSSLMSLSGTREGGALMLVEAGKYSEYNTPARASIAAAGGQSQLTPQTINDGRGISPYGRITTPFPLWDGTDRILVGYRPCEVTRSGVRVLCATLSADEIARLGDGQRMAAAAAADPLQDNVPANYAIYMYDPGKQTFLIVAAPPSGYMYTDPIALQARAEPASIPDAVLDTALASAGYATLEVRSVYDTDGLGRMGEGMLAASDKVGCSAGIAMKPRTDPNDTRAQVADLLRIKDPADPAYRCAPARFVRATRAVPPSSNTMGMREAIGETDFEPQQIVGYAPIEPDGSFKLQVPADTALALSVVDAKGRGIQTHLNWIQVRPGERRTCDGCHSPRRGAALNDGAAANTLPIGLLASMRSAHLSGETMAALRTRLDPAALNLTPDMQYTDVWADTAQPTVTARATITLRYTGNPLPADDLATAAPVNGMINYPEHIQPIWDRTRPGGSCASCHNDTAKLSLQNTLGGTGRLVSYDELLLGDPLIDPVTGQPVTRIQNGVPVLQRGAALVETMAGNAMGLARSSRLMEIIFGEDLKASAAARTAHPTPPGTAPDHAVLLNAAEKRLVTEWIDLGGQYYNNLAASGAVRAVTTNLTQASFVAQVQPVLQANCAGCHTPGGNSGASDPGNTFVRNRYILTGSPEGDFNVTLTMISNTCNAAANRLLSQPSAVPHPSGAVGQTTAVLPLASAGYTAIANWIGRGCPNP
jgi:Hydrazine synthase alpha subunit middle domain